MTVYEYLCNDCGPFTDMRPMAECAAPQDCPQCLGESPRVILTAPNFLCMPSDKRKAHAGNERSLSDLVAGDPTGNERSANAPRTVAEFKASHRPGCGCCSTRPSRIVKQASNGAKSFPTARPWMISH